MNGMSEVIESNFIKTVTEMASAVRSGVEDEFNAVNKYAESLDKRCTCKVESYDERLARSQAKIDGLKQAFGILEPLSTCACIFRCLPLLKPF